MPDPGILRDKGTGDPDEKQLPAFFEQLTTGQSLLDTPPQDPKVGKTSNISPNTGTPDPGRKEAPTGPASSMPASHNVFRDFPVYDDLTGEIILIDVTWADVAKIYPHITTNMSARFNPTWEEFMFVRNDVLRLLRADASKNRAQADDFTQDPDDPGGGGGGGGGGGLGGGSGLAYRKPDEAAVRDYVKSYVVATTGFANEALIRMGIAEYLAADQRKFDQRETQDVDPATAMKNVIRATSPYKAVNQLRPDSVDEMEWVSSQQGKLRQLGLSASLAEEVGIEQAIAATTTQELGRAANVAQQHQTGRLLDQQRASLQASATAALRLV